LFIETVALEYLSSQNAIEENDLGSGVVVVMEDEDNDANLTTPRDEESIELEDLLLAEMHSEDLEVQIVQQGVLFEKAERDFEDEERIGLECLEAAERREEKKREQSERENSLLAVFFSEDLEVQIVQQGVLFEKAERDFEDEERIGLECLEAAERRGEKKREQSERENSLLAELYDQEIMMQREEAADTAEREIQAAFFEKEKAERDFEDGELIGLECLEAAKRREREIEPSILSRLQNEAIAIEIVQQEIILSRLQNEAVATEIVEQERAQERAEREFEYQESIELAENEETDQTRLLDDIAQQQQQQEQEIEQWEREASEIYEAGFDEQLRIAAELWAEQVLAERKSFEVSKEADDIEQLQRQINDRKRALQHRVSLLPQRKRKKVMDKLMHVTHSECVVCQDERADHAIVPCGHKCVCKVCDLELKRIGDYLCPLCRQPATRTLKIYDQE